MTTTQIVFAIGAAGLALAIASLNEKARIELGAQP